MARRLVDVVPGQGAGAAPAHQVVRPVLALSHHRRADIGVRPGAGDPEPPGGHDPPVGDPGGVQVVLTGHRTGQQHDHLRAVRWGRLYSGRDGPGRRTLAHRVAEVSRSQAGGRRIGVQAPVAGDGQRPETGGDRHLALLEQPLDHDQVRTAGREHRRHRVSAVIGRPRSMPTPATPAGSTRVNRPGEASSRVATIVPARPPAGAVTRAAVPGNPGTVLVLPS